MPQRQRCFATAQPAGLVTHKTLKQILIREYAALYPEPKLVVITDI